jgi:hypothetical protein
VSSGSYTSTGLPWNNSSKPNAGVECVHVIEETGPGVFFAGLCCRRGCGRATVHRDPATGAPMHRLADLTGWPAQ